jgi:hypothetical protein
VKRVSICFSSGVNLNRECAAAADDDDDDQFDDTYKPVE